MKNVLFGSFDLAHAGHVERLHQIPSGIDDTLVVMVKNPLKINQSDFELRQKYFLLEQVYNERVISQIAFAETLEDILCYAKQAENIIRGYRSAVDKEYDFALAQKIGLLPFRDKLKYIRASEITQNISSSKMRVLRALYPHIHEDERLFEQRFNIYNSLGAAIFFGEDVKSWNDKIERGQMHPFVQQLSKKEFFYLMNLYQSINSQLDGDCAELAYREACLDFLTKKTMSPPSYYINPMRDCALSFA
ncbi:hypothetical protein CSB37_01365 [bacterium DOLZORAL124_38_8]|nr:MAG: hypothetical protein CSB37_01365 [bacterium DOLZORAL124_38_8]